MGTSKNDNWVCNYGCQFNYFRPMANTMKEKEPQLGDILEITWKDHYRFQGLLSENYLVKSWGRLVYEDENGYALAQNEEQKPQEGLAQVLDGQFILKPVVTEIEVLKHEKVEDS